MLQRKLATTIYWFSTVLLPCYIVLSSSALTLRDTVVRCITTFATRISAFGSLATHMGRGSVDIHLVEHIRRHVEACAADVAADEQLAGRTLAIGSELGIQSQAEALLPLLRLITRDKAHASRRLFWEHGQRIH